MPGVFAGGQIHRGGFRFDQVHLTFAGTDVKGFLVQNVNFNFAQQVTLLYEIGSNYVYYVGGRAQGTAAMGRIVGPAPLTAGLITKFNDICNPQDMSFAATAGCQPGGLRYTLQDAVLTAVSVSVASRDCVISEQLQFMYIDLEIG
jgi:hypothetical protein